MELPEGCGSARRTSGELERSCFPQCGYVVAPWTAQDRDGVSPELKRRTPELKRRKRRASGGETRVRRSSREAKGVVARPEVQEKQEGTQSIALVGPTQCSEFKQGELMFNVYLQTEEYR